jgi:hypothetical protein
VTSFVVWWSELLATNSELGFDSRRYQIFWEAVGLERGPLSLVSTTEELLGRKSNGSDLGTREYDRRNRQGVGSSLGVWRGVTTSHCKKQALRNISVLKSNTKRIIYGYICGFLFCIYRWLNSQQSIKKQELWVELDNHALNYMLPSLYRRWQVLQIHNIATFRRESSMESEYNWCYHIQMMQTHSQEQEIR